MSAEVVEELAHALRHAAGTDDDPNAESVAECWQNLTRHALDMAGIETTPEQFERAWRTCWRRAFMGGNYTLDAKAILRAIEGTSR